VTLSQLTWLSEVIFECYKTNGYVYLLMSLSTIRGWSGGITRYIYNFLERGVRGQL
jgi:hypothetical protein